MSEFPASTGWYLYAVVVCEGVLLCSAAQWLGPRWQGYATVSLTGLLLLLECYATHFVLIPYYIGLTSHNAEGGLAAFHISQATNLGLQGILSRMVVNKPAFLSPAGGDVVAGFCVRQYLSSGHGVQVCES